MKKRYAFLFALAFLLFTGDAMATHLVGGMIGYRCVGNNQYIIFAYRYRDCSSPVNAALPPNFDIVIAPINNSSISNDTINLSRQSNTQIQIVPINLCHVPTNTYCVEEHYYESDTLTLTANSDGYDIYNLDEPGFNGARQPGDCCRNASVNNIINPGNVGQVLHSRIPNPGAWNCNSSPEFVNYPPVEVCLDDSIRFDHSASDPDGDSLVYYFCEALDQSPYDPSVYPPFDSVPYSGVYSSAYPMPSSPRLKIDSVTGFMTGEPTSLGLYVVTVCVDEYRNGTRLGRYRREVQMKVVECTVQTEAEIEGNASTPGLILACDTTLVQFENGTSDTTPQTTYFWDFGVTGSSSDTSTLFEPSFNYPDSGTYQVMLIINKGYPCSDTAFATVLVYPGIEADFGADAPYCVGQPVNFHDSSTVAYGYINSYFWNFGDAGSASNTGIGPNPIHVYNNPGTYDIKLDITSSKGCQDSITKSIEVSPRPTLSTPNRVDLCDGDSIHIDITTDATQFTWSPNTFMDCDTCEDPLVWPPTNMAYNVTVTNSAGCSRSKNAIIVNVVQPPVADAGPTKYLCSSSVRLQGSYSGGVGAPSYSWSPAAGLSCTNCPKPWATPNQTTVYTLTVTMSTGCSDSDTVTVFTSNLSVTASTNDHDICPGDSTRINANSNTSGVIYNWSPGTGLSDSGIANPMASPAVTTVYTIEITDPVSTCISQDTVIVRVHTPVGIEAGPDTSICINESVLLRASKGSAYQWSSDPALSCSNCQNTLATPVITSMFTVSGIDSVGCPVSDSVTVTVNPLPIIGVSADTTICSGSSALLSATGGVDYLWSPAATVNCDSCATTDVFPLSNTYYTVEVTDVNGCRDTASVKVTVAPPPTITSSANQVICAGESVQISASGGQSYQWAPAAYLDNPMIADPVASPPSSTMFTVTVTDSNGCVNQDSVFVQVNVLQAGAFVSDTAICKGESVELYANGFVNYSWSPSSSLSCSVCPRPVATPGVTTVYTVYVADANGCKDTGTVRIQVNPLPVVSTSPDTYVCIGDSTQLNANASGAQLYVWTPAASLSDDSIKNPYAHPLVTSTYTVEVTDNNGCRNTNTVQIEVKALPVINKSPDRIVCEGDTAHIWADGGVSYLWSPGATLSCTSCPDPVAQPLVDQYYVVRVTDAYACVNEDSVFVKVNSLQPGAFIQDTAICIGESVELYANGFQTYSWWPGSDLSCTTCPTPLATPAATATYYVAVEDNNGCRDTGSVTVTVNPLPTVVIGSASDSICLGTSTQLNASGGISYQWSPSAGLSSDTVSNPQASPPVTTDYTVTVTDINACVNTASKRITVLPLPQISKSSDTYVCKYDSTQLTVSGGISYAWSPSASLSCSDCPDPFAFPLLTTVYTVEVTDSYGCVNKDSITISVNTAAGNISPDTAICIGESTRLIISGGVNYKWWPGTGLSCTSCFNPLASPAATTTYSVEVTDANGCRDTAGVQVTVNPLPVLSTDGNKSICADDSVQIRVIAPTGIAFLWTPASGLNDASISDPMASPASTTEYTVTVTDDNTCSDTARVRVTVKPRPNTSAGQDWIICLGDTAQLKGSGADSYVWSPAGDLECSTCDETKAWPASTQTYTLTGILNNGCTREDEVTVTVNPLPTVSIGPDRLICEGDTVHLLATGGVSYQWTPVSGLSCSNCPDPVASPLQTITYTVRAANVFNCFDETSITITVNSPASIEITADTSVCPGESVQLSVSGGVTYQWSPPVGLSNSNIPDPLATPSASTTYSVHIIDASGCEIDADVSIGIYVPAEPMPAADTTEICIGDTVVLSAVNGVIYSWKPDFSLITPGDSVSIAIPEENTVYTVTIIDIHGCENSDQIEIIVHPLPDVDAGPDQFIYQGGRARLNGSGASIYVWSPDENINDIHVADPIVFPSDTFVYYLTGVDRYGCINYDSVRVLVVPEANFDMPSAFTPDGDGVNDRFRISNPENFNLVSLKIYDRWGNIVFYTTDLGVSWDGTVNGVPVPMGTYIFIMHGVDDLGKEIWRKGNITLLR